MVLQVLGKTKGDHEKEKEGKTNKRIRRTLPHDTERILEQEEFQKQQKERIEQNDRMNIARELYMEELRVVACDEAISEPEEKDSFDEDDLVSTIAQYHEVYCQQMLSSSLKFAKEIHSNILMNSNLY